MNIPLRYKILAMMGVLLLSAIGFYSILASRIFREEKTALLYDINHSVAVNTAAQLKTVLRRIGDEGRLFVSLEFFSDISTRLSIQSLKDNQILGITLLERNGQSSWQPKKEQGRYPIAAFPLDSIAMRLRAMSPGSPNSASASVIRISGEVERYFLVTEWRTPSWKEQVLIVCEFDRAVLVDPILSVNVFKSYLVSSEGDLFVECDRNKVTVSRSILVHPLLSEAKRHGGKTSGVSSFSAEGQSWYGAYAPVGFAGLFFISQASRKEVDTAIRHLLERSVLFGLIVITFTFLVSILFSRRLTRNLARLAERASRIGQGDLTSRIEIRSHDEVAELAHSFNKMIEDLKASRDAIERYNRELEDKVALRTKQLRESNASIKEMQEELLKSTQLAAVGEVAGRTAHEVLNPLTAILSRLERSRAGYAREGAVHKQFSEIVDAWDKDFRSGGMQALSISLNSPSLIHPGWTLFEEDVDNLKKLINHWVERSDGAHHDLSFVEREARRIHRIVDQMRRLARSSENRGQAHCHEIIRQCGLMMSDFLAKHGITFKEELAADNDLAFLNQDELIQILNNLIRNAFQSIEAHADPERKKGTITLRTRNDGNLLWVEVQDTGTGISSENQARLFEQGFTTKSPDDGTGLGLAICRRYARSFGGEVELLSTASTGSCFGVRIPLSSAKDENLKEAV